MQTKLMARYLRVMLMLGTTVLLLLLGSCAATDEITSLPGWKGKLPSRQFSGFLSLPSQVRVHYWLVESEAADASKDPLVLWYNGGPPCSALVGMFGENGPFLVRPGVNESRLVLNHGRWSRSADPQWPHQASSRITRRAPSCYTSS